MSEIETLKTALAEARARVREIQERLNALRSKCPTCRCRILPGDECSCCASAAFDDQIAPIL